MSPSTMPATQNSAVIPATKCVQPAQCHKYHACHAKRRWIRASTTLAIQNQGRCRQMPCLPRKTKVDVAKCHACHAKLSGVTGDRPSTPKRATKAIGTTPATQNEDGCDQQPRLPHKTKVDAAKCQRNTDRCR